MSNKCLFPAALHVKRKILVFKIEIKPFFLTRLLFGFVLFLVIEGGQKRISSGENDHIFSSLKIVNEETKDGVVKPTNLERRKK